MMTCRSPLRHHYALFWIKKSIIRSFKSGRVAWDVAWDVAWMLHGLLHGMLHGMLDVNPYALDPPDPLDGRTDRWFDGRTDGRADGRTDGRTDGQMGRWTDGRDGMIWIWETTPHTVTGVG